MVDRSLLHCCKNANNTMVVQKKYAHTGSDVARVNKVRAAALGTRDCSVKYTESQKDRLKMGLTVGVWNVRSLWQTGAYALMKKELERFRYDVVGLCEARWTGGGEMEGGKILWSGTEREHVYGVGMVIGEKAKKALLEYNPVNERMINRGILRSTGAKKVLPKKDVKIITGDWNAKIGRDNIGFEEVMGKYGIGNRNNRGERLLEFAKDQKINHFCRPNSEACKVYHFQQQTALYSRERLQSYICLSISLSVCQHASAWSGGGSWESGGAMGAPVVRSVCIDNIKCNTSTLEHFTNSGRYGNISPMTSGNMFTIKQYRFFWHWLVFEVAQHWWFYDIGMNGTLLTIMSILGVKM
ncbi:hypothetical protein HELRODRAFT_173127 [Helobdella robusta]|uniref:Endonuclease/exonuclease/phosphatase domain-containing protein n=1 Tax=Helobdella robusta TaxID=6412 RepID=T1F6E8_HELRO|nr:hypothetical protein HELRODRAFT_173127 [Helobdella robusta]ESO04053.1 hypothetical protein HELRODRAFT_173127 [Helobdella robusta]